MKHTKTYLLAALSLCAGLVIFLIGFAMMGFNILNFDTEPAYVEQSYSVDGNISALTVEDENANISIKLSKDKKIHVKYYENVNKTYNITRLADGSVSIEKHTLDDFFNRFFIISISTPTLTIEIPENYSGKLYIENAGGNIMAEGISLGILSAEVDGGDIRISNSSISKNLEAEADGGDVEIYESSISDTCKLSGDGGRLFLQSVTAGNIYAEGDAGHITLVNIDVKENIFAENDGANIEISSVLFGRGITLIADGGSIRGSVVGTAEDFTYNCVATGGSCNLQNDTAFGAKQLNMRTKGGNIEVNFVTPVPATAQ